MTSPKKFTKMIMALIVIVLIIIVILIFSSDQNSNKEQLDNLTSKEAQAQSYVSNNILEIGGNDNVLGPENAQLKIFVYEDYANRYSADLTDTLEKISKENKNNVAIIVRPYITASSILSQKTALAINCSGNKWSKMRDLLFDQVKDNQLLINDFDKYADEIGLNENKFLSCLNSAEEVQKIDETIQEAKSYSILGAPTIFIDDEMILGARPYEDYLDSNGDKVEGLKTIVNRKLK